MTARLVACHECDLLQRARQLQEGCVARCVRCGAMLYRAQRDNIDTPLALTVGAVILFAIANLFPIVGLELQGQQTTATLLGTVLGLYDEGMRLVAALVFTTTILVPAFELGALLYVLLSLKLGRLTPRVPIALRLLQTIRPWGMIEVFMLGVLVSLIKLATVATVMPGPALWSFGGLMLLIAAAAASFDPRSVWHKIGAPA